MSDRRCRRSGEAVCRSGAFVACALVLSLSAPGCRPAADRTVAPDPGTIPLPADWSLVPEAARPAIREAADACRAAPHEAAAFVRLARAYHGNELADLAAQSYETALRLGADDAKTHYLLGLIHAERGEAAASIARFRAAVEREPNYPPAHYNLGQSLLDAGEIDAARDAFARAVELAPRQAAFHAGLGRALRQAGRLRPAEVEFRRALELEPENDEAHQLLGLTLRADGRADEARDHLERVGHRSASIVADPWLFEVQSGASSAEILVGRARIYLREGRSAAAVELLERAAASHPDRAAVLRLLGDAYVQAGRAQQAVDAYLGATRIDPRDAEAHAGLAVVLLGHGSLDDAEREARLALASDAEHAMARVVLANAELRRGEAATALATIRVVLDHRDDVSAAHLVHGEVLVELGRLAEAEAALARAAELEPRADYPQRRLEEIRRRLAVEDSGE